MVVQTCLLISDDPDDHVEFTEVLYDISSDIVVLVVMDPKKALDVLSLKLDLADYIIVDLTISGFSPTNFFNALDADPKLVTIPVIAYGEYSQLSEINNGRISAFLGHDLTYSRLRSLLLKALGN